MIVACGGKQTSFHNRKRLGFLGVLLKNQTTAGTGSKRLKPHDDESGELS
jgi:hypothetical protein